MNQHRIICWAQLVEVTVETDIVQKNNKEHIQSRNRMIWLLLDNIVVVSITKIQAKEHFDVVNKAY